MNRFGIVGCGSIGKRHIAVLDAESRAELVAICDEDAAALTAQSELYPYLATYNNYAEMLAKGGFDVVCIATPHEMHTEMAARCSLCQPTTRAHACDFNLPVASFEPACGIAP